MLLGLILIIIIIFFLFFTKNELFNLKHSLHSVQFNLIKTRPCGVDDGVHVTEVRVGVNADGCPVLPQWS